MIRGLRFDPKRGMGLFVILVGVVSVLLALTGTVPSPAVAVIIVVTVILLSAASAVRRRDDFIPEEAARLSPLTCRICTSAWLREANRIAAVYYRRDRIPNELVEEWRRRNPYAFACLLDGEERVVASFGVMALSDSFMDQFIAGNVVESQLSTADIHDWENTRRAERLYISGVVVLDAGTPKGQERARIMMWSMIRYFRQFFDPSSVKQVYALATTNQGERILQHLGFDLTVAAEKRRDSHNLYRVDLTPQWVDRTERLVPDYSNVCGFHMDDGAP